MSNQKLAIVEKLIEAAEKEQDEAARFQKEADSNRGSRRAIAFSQRDRAIARAGAFIQAADIAKAVS